MPTDAQEKRKSTVVALYQNDPDNPMKINLDRESIEYLPGETITGKLIFGFNEATEIKELKINVCGTGRTSWAISQKNKKKQLNDSHASSEIYLDDRVDVVSEPKAMPPGKTEIPFEYVLPKQNLPSTFIDGFGSITYVLKVNATTSTLGELSCMGAFLVNGVYDLNEDQDLTFNAELYDHKTVGKCCLKTGTVDILVKLPYRGYVLGDKIEWEAEIGNKSTSKISRVTARLLQHNLFHADKENKTDTKFLVTVNAGAVNKNSKEIWKGSLEIPKDIPPTGLGGGKLIVLSYALEFEVNVVGCTKNLKSEIPISIGTLPLKIASGNGTVKQFGKEKGAEPTTVAVASS